MSTSERKKKSQQEAQAHSQHHRADSERRKTDIRASVLAENSTHIGHISTDNGIELFDNHDALLAADNQFKQLIDTVCDDTKGTGDSYKFHNYKM